MKPRKWSSILLALTMILALIPANAFAEPEPIVEPNFGFVPNSGEASVSKVDLVNKTEVARYYTQPRVSPTADYNWRTSRIAMDAYGNAWVLNTGADGVNLQGSVVRIQADTTGLTTHAYPDPVLAFGTDEAVKVFNVGGLGDMPRAIAIDEDGYIWIGFYSSGALMKFEFDGTDLNQVGETIVTNPKLNFYEMKFAPDGMLYISSRNSTPTRSGDYGVWSFNPNNGEFTEEWNVDSPYSLLIDPDSGQVYATSYSNVLWIKGTGTVAISGAQNLRGMSFNGLGKIWIASTTAGSGGNRVCWYDIGAGTSGYITLPIGTTPFGVGMDEAGLMWAVCRTDGDTSGGYLVAFDPHDGSPEGSIKVGYRPYAYGDFVMPVPRYCIEGTKTEDFYTGLKTRVPLEDWSIYLYDRTLDPGEIPGVATEGLLASTMTDEFGDYKFCGLVAGTYYVYEMFDDCYGPFDPISGMIEVTLPDDGNDGNAVDQDFVNRRGKIQGIKFKDTLGTGTTLSGWEILLYKGEPAVGEPNKADAFKWTTTDSNGFYFFDLLCPDTYFVYELMQDGWVQTYPTEGFWTVELAAGVRATGKHFVNEEEEFFDLCGFKYGLDYAGFMDDPWPTDNPLPGWTIILERFEDDEWVEIDRDVTNSLGKYCFLDLPAGEYRLSEEADGEKDGFWMMNGKYWLQVGPEDKYIFASLPEDGMECGDCGEISIDCICPPPPVEKSFDFYNLCHTDETAWMFGDILHSDLGIPAQNWGWSLGLGIVEQSTDPYPIEENVPIYAGAAQNDITKGYLIGHLDIWWNGTDVEIRNVDIDENIVEMNMMVWIGNTELPLFRGAMTNAPGKLIIDPAIDYSKPVFVAVHFDSYVPCGFPHPEVMPE